MSNYDTLNPRQREAVFATEGPLLVLAGAGSGKTRVLTHRIAYLIEELGVNPWHILAITFTNKAAAEMRERVDNLVSFGAEEIWVSTFHSMCVRILRRYGEHQGYASGFTIYDGDDQRTLMRQILKTMNLDPKQYRERAALGVISSLKDKLITPETFLMSATDFRQKTYGEIYREYQSQLKKNNAMDFDDLICQTVALFENNPDILKYYQERFRYIMVDEYQDTNQAQFRLVSLLADRYKNLCVVGDDDQSIYKFRGADIENILSFEKHFPGAKVVRLEQNYRSTQNILDAANAVIAHNRGRKEKTLWTQNVSGEKVRVKQFDSARDEADYIAKQIRDSNFAYEDQAVLYRTNAQSRLIEERCVYYNVPYRLVGGVNFYQRKEIKDILAYLRLMSNSVDDLSVLRVINVPKRKIGATSVGRAQDFAAQQGISLFDAVCDAVHIPGMGKAAEKMTAFADLINRFKERAVEGESIKALIEGILDETGYREELQAEDEDAVQGQTRLENIEELINKAASYEAETEVPNLDEFLEQVALVADADRMEEDPNRVTLMTLHSAKGLEFPKVYLVGLEEGLFPSFMAMDSGDPKDVEEERRLCYVGITRAREELEITAAKKRMINGEWRECKLSRFVGELPSDVEVERVGLGDGERAAKPSGFGASTSRTSLGNARNGRGFGSSYNPYASAAKTPSSKPSFGKTFSVQKEKPDYAVGDRVMQERFGAGTVKEIKDGARDFEVTVEFDGAGQKRMLASFAKLQKISE